MANKFDRLSKAQIRAQAKKILASLEYLASQEDAATMRDKGYIQPSVYVRAIQMVLDCAREDGLTSPRILASVILQQKGESFDQTERDLLDTLAGGSVGTMFDTISRAAKYEIAD